MTGKVKNMFTPSERVKSPKGKQKAQQQFKEDADINSIMRKFQKTGAIDHVAMHQPNYGLVGPQDLHTAMNIVAGANTMFEELPSTLREKFADASGFLEFVQDPNNDVEARELGLALAPEAQAKADEIAAEAANNPAPEPPPSPDPSPADPDPGPPT